MAYQTQFAAQEGRGEAYYTGSNNVVDLDTTAPSGGVTFAQADTGGSYNANSALAEVKHVEITAVGGPAYYTTNGTTPDATVGFPLAAGNVMSLRNCRDLIKTIKFFVPAGTTLKVSWTA